MDFETEFKINMPLDADDMMGRMCPIKECSKRFGINGWNLRDFTGAVMYCSYCGHEGGHQDFMTQEQKDYVTSIVARKWTQQIVDDLKKYEVRPDPRAFVSFGITVKANLPKIEHYIEKGLKRVVKCTECGNSYSVYGISYFCPFHGERNALSVFSENADHITRTLSIETIVGQETMQRLLEEGCVPDIAESGLKDSVTAFETYCKSKYAAHILARNPSLTKKDVQEEIKTLFQNIRRGGERIARDCGYDFRSALKVDEMAHVTKCFSKRHVLVHNSGIIDDKYVQETGEPAGFVGRKVTTTKAEVEKLLPLLRTMVSGIDNGVK